MLGARSTTPPPVAITLRAAPPRAARSSDSSARKPGSPRSRKSSGMVCPEWLSISRVEVDERQPEPLRQPLPHRRLAGAHESGEIDRAAAAAIAVRRQRDQPLAVGRDVAGADRAQEHRGVGTGGEHLEQVRGVDAADRDQRLRGQRARAPQAVEPDHRIGVLLAAGGEDRPERHHVDVAIGGGGGDLIEVVGRERRSSSRSPTTARTARGGRSSCPRWTPAQREERRDVGAIVHPEPVAGWQLGARARRPPPPARRRRRAWRGSGSTRGRAAPSPRPPRARARWRRAHRRRRSRRAPEPGRV